MQSLCPLVLKIYIHWFSWRDEQVIQIWKIPVNRIWYEIPAPHLKMTRWVRTIYLRVLNKAVRSKFKEVLPNTKSYSLRKPKRCEYNNKVQCACPNKNIYRIYPCTRRFHVYWTPQFSCRNFNPSRKNWPL